MTRHWFILRKQKATTTTTITTKTPNKQSMAHIRVLMFDFGAVITDITKEEVGNYVKLLRNLRVANCFFFFYYYFWIIMPQYYVKEHWLELFSLSEAIWPMNCRISYSLRQSAVNQCHSNRFFFFCVRFVQIKQNLTNYSKSW